MRYSTCRFTLIFVFILLPLLRSCGSYTASTLHSTQEEDSDKKDQFASVEFQKLENFLDASCAKCHGSENSRGGVGNITDLRSLRNEELVVPGKPELSEIYDQIVSGAMPPDYEDDIRKPKPDEVALLRRWIEVGAPDPSDSVTRDNLGFEQTLRLVRLDLAGIALKDREHIRYLSLANLHNHKIAGEFVHTDAELASYRDLVALMVNSLSWNNELAKLRIVQGSGGALLRLDLRETSANPLNLAGLGGLDSVKWKFVGEENPYKISFKNEDAKLVRQWTKENFPVIRADFFVFFAMSGDPYYQIMQIPDNSFKLEKILLSKSSKEIIADHKNLKEGDVIRAGFARSDVSANNRLIERHIVRVYEGAYWLSYDFDGTSGRKNLLANPLGPEVVFGEQEFVFDHDGGEVIFNLPNGLQAYLLMKANGDLIEEGPTNIVANAQATRPEEAVIRNAISCTECHAKGMIRKTDEVLQAFKINEAKFNFKEELAEVTRKIYPESSYKNSPLELSFKRDSKRYLDSFNLLKQQMRKEELRVTLLPVEPDPSINALWQLYDSFRGEVGFSSALAEVDLDAEAFLASLRNSTATSLELGNFLLRDPKSVRRDTFKDIFKKVTLATNAAERGFVEPKPVAELFFRCKAVLSSDNYERQIDGELNKQLTGAKESALAKCNKLLNGKEDFGFSCALGECEKIRK